jgi:hypothetical protein
MSSIRKLERNRGLKESREQIKVLQDKWPAGFPKQASLVRPLANGTAKTIAEAFGWSVAYTRAVLRGARSSDAIRIRLIWNIRVQHRCEFTAVAVVPSPRDKARLCILEAMAWRLRTLQGKQLCGLRKQQNCWQKSTPVRQAARRGRDSQWTHGATVVPAVARSRYDAA